MTTSDIVAKLWNLCNIPKDGSVTYHQYVTELIYLLFLKMAKETSSEAQLPADHRWADLKVRAQRGEQTTTRLNRRRKITS